MISTYKLSKMIIIIGRLEYNLNRLDDLLCSQKTRQLNSKENMLKGQRNYLYFWVYTKKFIPETQKSQEIRVPGMNFFV